MAQKKSYSRYFIILQEDEKGYSLSSDKLASGYAKLEMKNDKCKISYYVQNLKKENAPYYMLLICSKKDVRKVIKISQMNIDDYGRADICHEYSADNIADTGISMDKISGAAIVKFLDSNIIPVMSGFASTVIPDWKTFDVVDLKSVEKKEEQPKVAEKNVTTDKSIFDKYEENIESSKKGEVEEIQKVKITENMDKKQSNTKVKQKSGSKSKEENRNIVKDQANHEVKEKVDNKIKPKEETNIKIDTEIKPKEENNTKIDTRIEEESDSKLRENNIKEEYTVGEDVNIGQEHENMINEKDVRNVDMNNGSFGDYPRGNTGSFFRNLAQGFEELGEICGEIKRCKWYKVPVCSEKSMCDMSNYNKYMVAYYPMINYYPYIKKHGHYLMGYKCDKEGKMKYLVYGIPGSKSKADQPYGGKSGFVTWISLNDEDNIGYWLMFYDFKTSTIVIPVKK